METSLQTLTNFFANSNISHDTAHPIQIKQNQSLDDNYNQQLPKLQISIQLASMIKEKLKQITLKAIHIFNETNSIQPTDISVTKISYISQTMKIFSIKDNKNNIFIIKGKINGTKLISQMIFSNQIFQTIVRPTKNSTTKKINSSRNQILHHQIVIHKCNTQCVLKVTNQGQREMKYHCHNNSNNMKLAETI